MTMTLKNKIILLSVAVTLIYILGALSGAALHRAWTRTDDKPATDTVTVWRTAEASPAVDTVSTTKAQDTAPISVPAEEVVFTPDSSAVEIAPDLVTITGTLSGGGKYSAQLLGVQPSLQHLQVSYPERLVSNTKYKPYNGWLLSATASSYLDGIRPVRSVSLVGLETSYNTGPLHIGIQGGAAFDYSGSWNISPYIGARLTIDISRMK